MNNSPLQATGRPSDYFSDKRCLQVGVLTNPLSGGNRKGGRAIRKLLAGWTEVLHREATKPDDVLKVLSDFAQKGVELLVINGGDGTVQAVLTVLGREKLFAKPPLLALLCAGTTSMLSRDVGVAGSPAIALQKIIDWSKAPGKELAVCSRPIVQVQRGSQAPLFGMFFGAGAICEGIKIFHSRNNPMGWRGQLMPALTMLTLLLAILFRNRDRLPPLVHKISFNGCRQEERADLLFLVSSLERLFLGMRPYWGEEDGPLYYTAVAARPKRLLRVLPSLFRSGKSCHTTSSNGYSSHKVQEIQLTLQGDFTLDGELYAVAENPVTISSAGPALFLCSCSR